MAMTRGRLAVTALPRTLAMSQASDRALQRPRPELWDLDEPMTLVEASAVFFPDGPLSLSSLRTAVRNGELAVARVAGKILTTPRAIRKMTLPTLKERQGHQPSGYASAPAVIRSGSFSTEARKSAQNAGQATIAALRASLRPLSRGSKPGKPQQG